MKKYIFLMIISFFMQIQSSNHSAESQLASFSDNCGHNFQSAYTQNGRPTTPPKRKNAEMLLDQSNSCAPKKGPKPNN